MNKITLQKRKQKALDAIKSYGVDALVIESSIDLFYLTGLHLSAGQLIISPLRAALFVDGRYTEACHRQTLYPVFPLSHVSHWLDEMEISTLGFDQQQTTFLAYTKLKDMMQNMKKKGSTCEIVPLASPIELIRLIKSKEEIDALRESARLGKKGIDFLKDSLREGVREVDLAFELEFFWRKQGASQLAFPSIIAFGENTAMPHYRAGETKLTRDTVVLMDVGCVLNEYPSDMTRMAFFGTAPDEIQKIFSIVQEANQRAIAHCKQGITVGQLDTIARNFISEKGYGAQFVHGLGHGIGLEVHEMPSLRETGIHKDLVLQPGMVITIEPGIYLPGIGGVRLEDMILITEEGHENLTVD